MFFLRRVVIALALLVGAVVGALVILAAAGVVRTWAVPSSAMEPTLRCADATGCTGSSKDRVLSLKYIFDDADRGDIVAFRIPRSAVVQCGSGGTSVMRIVGLPGERWEERTGAVYVNGRRLSEPYVDGQRRDARTIRPVRIAPGHYFVLGDNRSASCDSRVWGPLAKDAIVGRIVLRYWPPTRIGVP
jgi:signal peptidase I